MVVVAFLATLLSGAPAARAQEEPVECIVETGSIDPDAGTTGEGLVAGGWIWRMSYRTQTISALDPTTLEPGFEKSLGETDAAILAPLAAVGDHVAASISGPGVGLVQFLDSASGTAVATIEIDADPDDDAYRYVTSVIAVGDVAYVAAGHELVAIDLTALERPDPSTAVSDRIPLQHPAAALDVLDGELVIRELFDDRLLTLTDDGVEPLADDRTAAAVLRADEWVYEISATGLVRFPADNRSVRPSEEIPTPGTPTAFASTDTTLWVVSGIDDSVIISAVDTETTTVIDEFPIDARVNSLWVAGDVIFVETPDDALALTLGRCRA